MSIDIVNQAFDLWLKPGMFLIGVLMLVRWNTARSPASSHWLLVALGLLTFALIPASFFLPRLELAVLPSHYDLISLNEGQGASALLLNNLWFYALCAAYICPVMFLLFAYAFDFLSARQLVAEARPVSLISGNLAMLEELQSNKNVGVQIRVSEHSHSPVLWGAFNPIIVLPSSFDQWSSGRLQRVLAHEIAHARRWDWMFRNLAYLACACFWPIPGVWRWMHRSNLYAEFACDDWVISRLDCRAEYASDLLALAQHLGPAQHAPAFSEQRHLYQRLNQVLDGGRNREINALWLRALALLCVMLFVLPIFSLKLVKREEFKPSFPPIQFEVVRAVAPRVSETPRPAVIKLETRSEAPDLIIEESFIEESSIEESLIVEAPSWEIRQQRATPEIGRKEPLSRIEMHGFVALDMQVPEYPYQYLRRGVETEVLAVFDISPEGRAENIRLEMRPKRKAFLKSVEKALNNSQFRPVEINGQAVRLKNVTEHYIFKIDAG